MADLVLKLAQLFHVLWLDVMCVRMSCTLVFACKDSTHTKKLDRRTRAYDAILCGFCCDVLCSDTL
jgi:hypothetical protein